MCYSLGTLGQETDGRSGCSWAHPGARGKRPRPSHGWPGAAVVFGAGTGAAGVTRPSPPALTRHGPSRHLFQSPRPWVAGRLARGNPRRPRPFLPGAAGRPTSAPRHLQKPRGGGALSLAPSVCSPARSGRPPTGVVGRPGGSPGAAGPWSRIATGLLPCPVVVVGEAFMAERVIDRRQVLRGAGVAAGGAAVGAFAFAAPASANDTGSGKLAGSWLIIRQDDGSPDRVTAVLSFAGGDVMIEHDINPAGPPSTGTWQRDADHRFRALCRDTQSIRRRAMCSRRPIPPSAHRPAQLCQSCCVPGRALGAAASG